MTVLWQGAAVFVLTTVVSVFWSLYFRYAAAGRAAAAAWADVGIVAVGVVNVLSYTHSKALVVPLLLGTWVGTYIGVRRKAVR